ncbi:hypothetical protein L1049_019267 [Liquidambar formosana]|uniref:Cytochrome P450 n=1 Tax=Liquidambar formosana TaxID=63359 RepID=A0AAP0X6E6_LIQFO
MISYIFSENISILFAALLAISWYAWLTKKPSKNTPPLPPGPRGLPFVGNLPFVEPDFHRYLAKLSNIYGPIFKLKLGSKISIVISSPSLAKQVLKDQDAICANRDPPAAGLALTYGGIDIAWRPNGPEWRELRKVFVREMMRYTRLDASSALRGQEVRGMVREVHGKVGTPINIGEHIFLTLRNVVISMLWGGTMHGEDSKSSIVIDQYRQVVDEMVELLGKPNISDVFPVLARFDLQGIESKMKKLLLWFDRIFDSEIAQRTKVDQVGEENEDKSKGSKDFLQFLLELNLQGDEKSSLSIIQIKALFMDIVIGATDTSSTIIEWAMAEMLQHPETMKKVQEELVEVVGNDNIVEDFHLSNLHYLDAVVKETFRLHPPLPLLVPHVPSVSCTLAGYTIPKGVRIFINAWAIQRHPEAWEDPLDFRPERFLLDIGKGDYSGNNFSYLPFGSGRRICVGVSLAEKLVVFVLASLLHSFEWKLPEGAKVDFSEKCGLVLKKTKPLVAIPFAKLTNLKHYN